MVTGENKAVKLRVAAIQMALKLGKVEENIRHATSLIEHAAAQGAKLIVLPEMCMTGYAMTKQLWGLAEPAGGPIEQWMGNISKRLGIYLGAGLVEAEGEDFYNTFLITGPDGKVAGRVRKTQTEYIIFKAGELSSHVIDTAIGRIGVGICADTHKVFLPRLMQERDVDILLMPHAWPAPYKTSKIIKEKDITDTNENARSYAMLFAKMLGVPVIFVNHIGPLEGGRWAGILGGLIDAEHFQYAGNSTIVDSDLAVKAQAEQDERVIVADITLDASRKLKGEIPDHGGWTHPGDAIMRNVILPIEISRGKLIYRISAERKRKALAVSSAGSPDNKSV
jgi:N-carbamoylputrescine amidase